MTRVALEKASGIKPVPNLYVEKPDTHTHRHTQTDTHRQTHTDTHRHTQTHTDTHRHTQTHTHTDAVVCAVIRLLGGSFEDGALCYAMRGCKTAQNHGDETHSLCRNT